MIALLCGLLASTGLMAEAKPGDLPPDLLGRTLDGQTVTASALHGKVVVLGFWATWCKYCMKEMPILAGLQTLATDRRLPLQVVYVNSKEDRPVFVRASRVLNRRMPGLLITWDEHGSIGEPYGASRMLPVMVLLHKNGSIADIRVGYGESDLDELVAEINTLMAEATAPAADVPTGAATQ
ncbi:TlpA disulfide reductase family protein [Rhodanobacter sp. DHB23]|uniref:TlpA family protein disulfide reductase n=1 Tax=Rhodanobacter sp. DHB23 TaxID=2775923 RepID=UPI001CE0A997|nr:TlpA disulfide reductase family protein [Rhodanobacter sp. DHB23]